MTEAPEPVWDRIASDDYICALGRVVYEANRLEGVAASRWYEWAHMAGENPHLKFSSKAHAMTKRSPVDALIKVLNKTEPKTDRVKKHLDWARGANRLLKRRHQVTHVVYVQFDDPQVLAMYFDKDGRSATLSTLTTRQICSSSPPRCLLTARPASAPRSQVSRRCWQACRTLNPGARGLSSCPATTRLRRASPAPDHCVEPAGRGAVRQQGPDALVKRDVGEVGVGHGDLLLSLRQANGVVVS
jgi:hypothetical protein